MFWARYPKFSINRLHPNLWKVSRNFLVGSPINGLQPVYCGLATDCHWAFLNFLLWHSGVVSFVYTKKKFAYFWRSILKRTNFFRTFHATKFFFAATTTFFDLKCCFLFLWPTNCSNLMCMNWHTFWCIIGSARAKSLGGHISLLLL